MMTTPELFEPMERSVGTACHDTSVADEAICFGP
jgi:hypothetical protein